MNGLRRNDDAMKNLKLVLLSEQRTVNNEIQYVEATLFVVHCSLFTNPCAVQAV